MVCKRKYDIEIAFMHGWSTKVISGSNNKKSKKEKSTKNKENNEYMLI